MPVNVVPLLSYTTPRDTIQERSGWPADSSL